MGLSSPISENAIERVWRLVEDVSAIMLDDQVLFINTTIAEAHML
jgi:hypothetical protein